MRVVSWVPLLACPAVAPQVNPSLLSRTAIKKFNAIYCTFVQFYDILYEIHVIIS